MLQACGRRVAGCIPTRPKRYETNNKTEKDYDTAQEKDGICAVQIIQA